MALVLYLEVKKGLAEKKSLNNGTSKGNHGKAAMDNFLLLANLLLIRRQLVKLITSPSKVTGCSITIVLLEIHCLNNTNGEENLQVSSETNRARSTKDVSVCELFTRNVKSSLLNQNSNNGKHADTTMLDFRPTSIVQVSLNIRQAHGVETHISWHRSIQLLRSDQEGDRLGHLFSIQRDGSCPSRLGGRCKGSCTGNQKRKDGRSHHGGTLLLQICSW
mmetsp:Transcript_105947/g.304617  ORF Transcript_105947/g.304617 Transcript_105947/m.304617 type:complete len:219 (-) Transcript_105947:77-733(-)